MKREALIYEMILKRKSFHIFKETGKIASEELTEVEAVFQTLRPLAEDIKVDMRILPAEETNCKRGQEYCILLYSERKPHYLQNIGFIGEQMDLYLASKDIGALWLGIGKADEEQAKYHGLDFVIMFAIAKMPTDKFRKDMFKSKRKSLEEIRQGEYGQEIGIIARFSPSACNTQPCMVESGGGELKIFRYKKPGKRGIMPADKVAYYNRIDIGIFLLFVELWLENQGMRFERTLAMDESDDEAEKVLAAMYRL